MTFHLENTAIVRVALLPQVREAAEAGARLISLWPLDDKLLDNDAKYTENLQVRLTRAMAELMTGQEVTIADAEFVYEGAEEIPGRPQEIVDALLAANDMCDTMADYSQTGDTSLVMRAAAALKVQWDETTVQAVAAALETVESVVGTLTSGDGVANGVDVEAVAQRFATVIVACDGLIGVIDDGAGPADAGDDSAAVMRRVRRALPVMAYVNEVCERLALPPLYCGAQAFIDVVTGHGRAQDSGAEGNLAFAEAVAPLAAAEWNKHREDLLWDPERAKKQAKEDDERRSREALAAKFADVPAGD